MNELDVLRLFYDEMVLRGATRDKVFLTIEEQAAAMLSHKLGMIVSEEQIHHLADICIANEWIERTTADPYYKYLSLTEAGLQMILANRYASN